MKTAKSMQQTIEKICINYQVSLTEIGMHLRLDIPSYNRLCIEVVDKNLVSVAHYFVQEGDLMADPEIVYFTGYGDWIPIEITQAPVGIWRRYAELNPNYTAISRLAQAGIADLAVFSNMWAQNLKIQGWLEVGLPYKRAVKDGE